MKLIEEIIENLSSDTPNLNNALFKTKVLLHHLGEDQLISWVNSELNGYPDIESVPEYRVITVSVYGNASNMAWRYSDHPLPLFHLDKKIRKNLETQYLTQSIAVIESYTKDDKDLTIAIAPEYFPLLSKGLSGGYPKRVPTAGRWIRWGWVGLFTIAWLIVLSPALSAEEAGVRSRRAAFRS